MPTLIDKLQRLGHKPEQQTQSRKVVCVKENGKKYTLNLDPAKVCAVYQVDGRIIKVGNKCDKLIAVDCTADGWAEIFVELKGKDINHAILQLEETLKNNCFCHQTVKIKRARIVGQSIPKNTGNSVMEIAKIRFVNNYHCDLRAFSSTPNETI